MKISGAGIFSRALSFLLIKSHYTVLSGQCQGNFGRRYRRYRLFFPDLPPFSTSDVKSTYRLPNSGCSFKIRAFARSSTRTVFRPSVSGILFTKQTGRPLSSYSQSEKCSHAASFCPTRYKPFKSADTSRKSPPARDETRGGYRFRVHGSIVPPFSLHPQAVPNFPEMADHAEFLPPALHPATAAANPPRRLPAPA